MFTTVFAVEDVLSSLDKDEVFTVGRMCVRKKYNRYVVRLQGTPTIARECTREQAIVVITEMICKREHEKKVRDIADTVIASMKKRRDGNE